MGELLKTKSVYFRKIGLKRKILGKVTNYQGDKVRRKTRTIEASNKEARQIPDRIPLLLRKRQITEEVLKRDQKGPPYALSYR